MHACIHILLHNLVAEPAGFSWSEFCTGTAVLSRALIQIYMYTVLTAAVLQLLKSIDQLISPAALLCASLVAHLAYYIDLRVVYGTLLQLSITS